MDNIFDFTEKLIDRYRNFTSSFVHLRAKDISDCSSKAYEERRFWPDTLIQITPNYKKSMNVKELADEGTIMISSALSEQSTTILGISPDMHLRFKPSPKQCRYLAYHH